MNRLFIILISLILVSSSIAQTDTISTYSINGEYWYEAISLLSDSTYHYRYSGCTEGGIDTGRYSITNDILELNSFKTNDFLPGDFIFYGNDFKNDSTSSSFEIKLLNSTSVSLSQISIEIDGFPWEINNVIIPKEKLVIGLDNVFTPSSMRIYFKELGRHFWYKIDKESNFLICVIKENSVSQKKQIPLRKEKLDIKKHQICGRDKENGFFLGCLNKQ
ncbi:MAG: hypothetical protein P1U44_05145 [Vicingaceae bacterium]|nr:hypothetical protein [Vicingaceae bacterium]